MTHKRMIMTAISLCKSLTPLLRSKWASLKKVLLNSLKFRRFPRALAFVGIALLIFIVALKLVPLNTRTQPEYSRLVLFENGSLLRAYLTSDQKWRFPVSSKDLPSFVTEGLMCLEDKRFRTHPGVDPFSIARAFRQNVSAGRVVSGGSTISMQVARLLDRKPRTLTSKALEVFQALHLEAQLSKAEILDLYLTYAPFGTNIEGIEAAAQRYFEKPARLLSSGEAAFLFLLPQSPHRWDKRDAESLRAMRSRVLERWRNCQVIDEVEFARAEGESLPAYRLKFTDRAEHLADTLLKQNPKKMILETTLNGIYQKSLEEYADLIRDKYNQKGIQNIGVAVLDNKTGEVKALLGNFRYHDDLAEQKISSFNVFRSTGSLLKPFLFAKLIELGQILPQTLLEDVPLDVDGYDPKNYDGTFNGLVEAQQSLSNSLNVPFIRELKNIGLDNFLNFLFEAEIKTNLTKDKLGLSVIVGGLQANLLDLTKMYSALATEGRIKPLKMLKDQKVDSDWQWIHPGAVVLTNRALAIRGRPDFAIDPQYLRSDSQIFWKTGTSQGRLDAWAIGYDANFTVAVWLGNLTNEPSPALVGPEVAAPVMFDVFSRIRTVSPERTPLKPFADHRHLGEVEVCAFSGLPAGDGCPVTHLVEGIKGLVPSRRCPYHQQVLVDARSGYRITQECKRPSMKEEVRAFVQLPPDVNFWAEKNFPNLPLRPAFHPACKERPVEKGRLQIVTPLSTHYLLHSGFAGSRMNIPLKLKTQDLATDYKCYLNGRELSFLRTEFDRILSVGPGDYELFCVDKVGRSDQVEFSVEL